MNGWFEKIKNLILLKKQIPPKIDFCDLSDDTRTAWWGSFYVEPEQSRYVKIGSVIFCIDHYNDEWHIAKSREGKEKTRSKSIAAHKVQGELILSPILPDRILIFTLPEPLFLASKTKISLYLRSPVYIRLSVGNPPIEFEEEPTKILSDTWYGKNTRTGELCYSVSNSASSHLDASQRDNTHTITPMVLQNNSQGPILLKEVKLSTPLLSIFSDDQNHLWTEQVSTSIEDHGVFNSVIMKGPPNGIKNLKQLSPPRLSMKTGFVSLFNVWNRKI